MKNPPRKILILGSGALKIGEAGEFDYSGSQALKALREERITTVLVNPNIATVQTSDQLADQVYFLPLTPAFVEEVIRRERPDAILLGFGGQTALNCGLELFQQRVLERYGVEVLGTPLASIRDTEDRGRFVERLSEIDVKVPRSATAGSVDEALKVAADIGYPVMLRIAYALGGLGSGVCRDEEQLRTRTVRALAHSPQVLIEECLNGWKEIEYEVVRDKYDNCITVCNMENLDPMGIHTGESIVVAPSQTLTNREYHHLRRIAITVIRHLRIVGECNIQFALDPRTGDYRVIEVNARLSRSSALASKATGYPLAFIAAKLALGYALTELPNVITGATMACFEPALDYVVVKVPRWDLQKFRHASVQIGSAMKSVGEVMAIGRSFEEALQKALRMLQIEGIDGLVGNGRAANGPSETLGEPTPDRIFSIGRALQQGTSVDAIHEATRIDPWFLHKLRHIVDISARLHGYGGEPDLLLEAKQAGFSDRQIAAFASLSERQVLNHRDAHRIAPVVKQIDTLAAEFPAQTNYLYLTYNAETDDVIFGVPNGVMVLGSGPYRIGSSVEFDWCSVNAVQALRDLKYRTVVVNCNPETVSTDYNECDRLYFEELSLEVVREVWRKERSSGIVISVGGQASNNLAVPLRDEGLPVLGTAPECIDMAENRHRFSRLLDGLGVEQPQWKELQTQDEARAFARSVGYPVLVRPSYVLSGTAMSVASDDAELVRFLERATAVSPVHPVVVSKFLENAKELEMDAVACRGRLVIAAISEHVENAGVHSGDATLVFPAQRTYIETLRRIRRITERIAEALEIHGPFNIQFVAKGNDVKVIECNLRASRSFPFVSKVLKVNLIQLAVKVMMDQPFQVPAGSILDLDYVGVKAPQFSFARLDGADPTLGVEMASTGEVGCLGDDFEEAFLKALVSVGYRLPVRSVLLSTGPVESKAAFLKSARALDDMGVTLYATPGTADFLAAAGIRTVRLHWPLEQAQPNTLDYLAQRRFDLVINIPKNVQEQELTNDYLIRRRAVDFGVPLMTNIQLAQRFVEAISHKRLTDLHIKSWSEYGCAPVSTERADLPVTSAVLAHSRT